MATLNPAHLHESAPPHDDKLRDKKRRRKKAGSDDSDERRWHHKVLDGYKFERRIGSGSFGDCYSGVEIATRRHICVKVEDTEAVRAKLQSEHMIMKLIEKRSVGKELLIPRALHITSDPPYNVLVQELLGPSLEDIFQKCNKSFDAKTVLMLAPLIIDTIQQVHESGVIHKDIKPHNFLLGRGEAAHKVYIIDFGLSKKYHQEGKHQTFRIGRSLIGTARYVGLNIHRGYEASRRDDMESIAYMLLYFLRGRLPWQGVGSNVSKQKRNELIHTSKESTSAVTLCEGFPTSFRSYLQYVKTLEFMQDVDYDYCRHLFREDYLRIYGAVDYSQYIWARHGVYP
eukprot:TRINITY_DN39552_c0_g1_i1.p1 TRINITY_DN39552_c0_g1~~TRINITY_DN39552_c0_g1_i1.p1  ORF type:complete len:342 (+),score=125.84 TRINITY_DN39552_c0_g1_i1:71-1096(+)